MLSSRASIHRKTVHVFADILHEPLYPKKGSWTLMIKRQALLCDAAISFFNQLQ